jgi:hypothetical protein
MTCPNIKCIFHLISSLSGYYSPNGSVAPVECEIGFYNPYYGMSECIECEPGFYCPFKAMTDNIACPAGKYCGNGTYVPTDCPPSTYSNM